MTTASPRRRARTRAIVASLAATLTVVLATASPAGAAVSVSGGPTWTDGQLVTVSGNNSSKPTADVVTVAQCEVTTGVTPGTRCSSTGATSFTAITGGTFSVANFELDQAWALSWNYTVNPPTSSFTAVDCATIGTATCAVLVSFYDAPNYPAGPFTHVGAETFVVTY